MFEIINFTTKQKYIEDFLLLPSKLYAPEFLVQNINEERDLLSSQHILSKYFDLHKFLAYCDGEVCARCVITVYPDNKELGYIGFFECINDSACAKALFDEAEDYCRKKNIKKIIGPLDASFWLKYRLKANKFSENPYVGEPFNKDYYQNLFSENSYAISERYISNSFKKVPLFGKTMQKYRNRYREFKMLGYKIVSASNKCWDKQIKEIYNMITGLYGGFSMFKNIEFDDFKELFKHYRIILDFSMVKIAYKDGKAVGFFIGMPDYKNMLYGKISALTYLKVFLKKIRSCRYIMLYMGVEPEHTGLGKAITYTIIRNVRLKRAHSVGAFIKIGNSTETYAEELSEERYEYIMFEKVL